MSKIVVAIAEAELRLNCMKFFRKHQLTASEVVASDVLEEELNQLKTGDVLLIAEQWASVALADLEGIKVVVLCNGEVSDYFVSLGLLTLPLPFSPKKLASVLGLSQEVTGTSKILGESPPIRKLRQLIAKYAPEKAPVHINGESGTGKELVAMELHEASGRPGKFVAVNCAALSEQLLESELFGHEKGAFTGAINQKKGLLEEANGGTLFLDEVGDMPASLQVKLLRVLQEGKVRSVGGLKEVAIDVRVVSATHKHLASLVKKGEFREDLYYRLVVLPLQLPPLRERPGDVGIIAKSLAKKELTEEAMELLATMQWRGNVRELQTVITRAEIHSEEVIDAAAILAVQDVMPPQAGSGEEDDYDFVLGFRGIPTKDQVVVAYYEKLMKDKAGSSYRDLGRLAGVSGPAFLMLAKKMGITETRALH